MARMLETHLAERVPAADRRMSAEAPAQPVAKAEPAPMRVAAPEPLPPLPTLSAAQPPAPAPAVDEAEGAVLDAAVTGQLLDMAKIGGASAVARIYRLYLENGPPALAEIDTAIAAGDHAHVARAAHALKSMSLSLGATRVASVTGELEKAGRQEQRLIYAELRAGIAEGLDEAYAAIEALMAEHGLVADDAASAA